MQDVVTPDTRMKSLRLAWVVLILQMLAVGGLLWKSGQLAPRVVPDTSSYRDFPWQGIRPALGDIRTPGYPLFLQVAELVGTRQTAAPTLQMLAYFLAVALMFSQLQSSTQSVLGSLAAASSLLYSNILHGYVATIATDTLASGLGIAALALTIGFVTRPHPGRALVLGLVVSLGWLVRPAYLFLILLCPILAALMSPLVVSVGKWRRTRLMSVLFVCCLLPLLLYCGIRWAIVGQFGIVSFGGYNLIGVSGQFMDEADLPGLPADLRPIAESALRHRRESEPRGDFAQQPRLHYLRMETEYDPTIWSDFVPAAQNQTSETPVNVRLKRLGMKLVVNHPREYTVWLIKAVRQGAKKLFWDFLDNPVFLVVSLAVWCMIPCVVSCSIPVTPGVRADDQVLKLSLLLAATYAASNLVLVILVCPPLGRFTDAAGVYLGMPLFGGLVVILGRLRERLIH